MTWAGLNLKMSQEDRLKLVLLPAVAKNKKPWMYSYKTKPYRVHALNICRYGSRCSFQHIHKSQDSTKTKKKSYKSDILSEFQRKRQECNLLSSDTSSEFDKNKKESYKSDKEILLQVLFLQKTFKDKF